MQALQPETEEQEKARLIDEIIARDDIGYPPDSPHTAKHRETLAQTSLAHLRELIKVHGDANENKTLNQ